jgi:hypothetical protein
MVSESFIRAIFAVFKGSDPQILTFIPSFHQKNDSDPKKSKTNAPKALLPIHIITGNMRKKDRIRQTDTYFNINAINSQ